MEKYYDNWKDTRYVCGCSWEGFGKDLRQGEDYTGVIEFCCPKCRAVVIEVAFPTLNESRANWDKLNAAERKWIETIEKSQADFERGKLQDASQLPNIDERSFVLDWDTIEDRAAGSETFIKHGDRIIFREPARYEGYNRFVEVAQILRQRYGKALTDLRPTKRSELYLYGDCFASLSVVAEGRKRIFPTRD